MPAQPIARFQVPGTRLGDQPPVRRRVVHAPQVHQLVDEEVFPHRGRHQYEPPVQADVAVAAAAAPARTLVADADARHGETVLRGDLQEARRQLVARVIAQGPAVFDRPAVACEPGTLSGDPLSMPVGERFGLAA